MDSRIAPRISGRFGLEILPSGCPEHHSPLSEVVKTSAEAGKLMQNCSQRLDECITFSFCPHCNAQELIYPRMPKVTHDDGAITQLLAQGAGIALSVAGEDEISC